MIQQLRIYEIFEINKIHFHQRFRDHAARIMRERYGFRIVAMWENVPGERIEFAYLLEWPDEAAKTAAWSAFMADAEWTEIKRVTHAAHGLMVGEIEDRSLVQTDYSPALRRSLFGHSRNSFNRLHPSGNSVPIYGNRVKRKIERNRKYFAFSEVRSVAYDRHPVPTRGALTIVTNAGRERWTWKCPWRSA